jgi:hypothetical protein
MVNGAGAERIRHTTASIAARFDWGYGEPENCWNTL